MHALGSRTHSSEYSRVVHAVGVRLPGHATPTVIKNSSPLANGIQSPLGTAMTSKVGLSARPRVIYVIVGNPVLKVLSSIHIFKLSIGKQRERTNLLIE